MKRLLSVVCVLFVLLSVCVAPMPVNAESEMDWIKITYTLEPKEEGAAPGTGDITADTEIPGSCTLHWDPNLTVLMVDGVRVENGFKLDVAGEYELKAVSRESSLQFRVYKVTVLPDVNLVNGQVFTSYPTIVCTNAIDMEHMKGTVGVDFVSGTTVRELGSHLLTIFGKGKNGSVMKFEYRFYVKACHAERVFDAASGKEALNIIVGSFDDMTVAATLDGTRVLSEGSNIETKIGQHTLEVLANGEKLTSSQKRPSEESMFLRVELYVDAKESKEPFYFDLSRWDTVFLLDGKVVTGDLRVGKHGAHTLSACDANGQTIKNALSVTVGDAEKPTVMTDLAFTFRNPHILYAIIVAVPTVALLAAAGYFLVARRKVV